MTTNNDAAPVSKITFEDLVIEVDKGNLKEADLEQYFELHEDMSNNLAPDFRLDPEKVSEGPRGLGQAALNAANFLCKRARQREYNKRTWDAHNNNTKLIRVMAEGDSWFQYPFKLDDTIDHLNHRKDLGVLCYSDAGDILSNMVNKREFQSGLADQLPHYFLLSGGGNDLVDGAGIRRYLLSYKEGRSAKDYLRPEYSGFRNSIYGGYRNICSQILAISPHTKILCHGYSLPVPNNGKWLGKPMNRIGITDQKLQRDIIKVIMDDVNKVIKDAISSFGNSAKFVDVRGTVPDDGWHDEFHPTSEHFGTVAAAFSKEIV